MTNAVAFRVDLPIRAAFNVARVCTLMAAWLWGSIVAGESFTFDAGRALFDSGKFEDAQRVFEPLSVSDPNNAEVLFLLGEIALRHNELGKAVELFERAVASAPHVSRYHHRLGDAFGRSAQQASIFSALGFARKCLAAYQRAVDLDPENLDARFSLFMFYRNAPGLIGGGKDKAASEAAAIKQVDPDRGRIAFAALHVTQKKFAQARAELAGIRPLDLATLQSDQVFLSDVEWSSAKVGWNEPARNHAWFNEKSHPGVVLIVHGRLYAKGLYAHAPSRYTFDLRGKWKTFSATVGLREGADPQGSAIFTVRGDGRELFRSGVLRVDASQHFKLDVSGIRELELVTEPGEEHNHNAWAIWAEPMLTR